MRKHSRYYNNGVVNIMVADGQPIPEGYVSGMVKRSREDREKSNQKRKQTNLSKYGVPTPQQSKAIQEKTRQTNLARYGAENVSQVQAVQEKRVQTFIERFGTDNPMSLEDVKAKLRATNLERYGVENPFASDEVKEKIRESNLERLGVEYPMQSPEVLEKARQTFIQRYGASNPLRLDDLKERVSQTCQEKYGVPWACMRPEARAYSNDSGPNREFAALLDSEGIQYEREFRIGKYSFDFKVGRVLIEVDPSYTHNILWNPFGRDGVSKEYHLEKSNTAQQSGYRTIHVFDWDDPKKIPNLLKARETVYARKCEVREVSLDECGDFLNRYHLQGSCKGQKFRYGLYCQDKLVSLMTFGEPRYNIQYQYELIRFCSVMNVIGGAAKLFTHFVRENNPQSVVSYCDRSKFLGTVYPGLGMVLKSVGSPSCHWYNGKTKRHITDNLLRQRGADQLLGTSFGKGTSNEEIMIGEGFIPVYDCGQNTYVWKNPV